MVYMDDLLTEQGRETLQHLELAYLIKAKIHECPHQSKQETTSSWKRTFELLWGLGKRLHGLETRTQNYMHAARKSGNFKPLKEAKEKPKKRIKTNNQNDQTSPSSMYNSREGLSPGRVWWGAITGAGCLQRGSENCVCSKVTRKINPPSSVHLQA